MPLTEVLPELYTEVYPRAVEPTGIEPATSALRRHWFKFSHFTTPLWIASFVAIVATLATGSTVATIPSRYNPTTACCMRRLSDNFIQTTQFQYCIFPEEVTDKRINSSEITTMSLSAPSPSATLADFRKEIVDLYKIDRTHDHAIRIKKILAQLEAIINAEEDHFGPALTGDLTPVIVSKWVKSREHLAAPTRKSESSTLRSIFTYAKGQGWLERNPFEGWSPKIKGTKAKKKRHHPYSDVRKVLEHLSGNAGRSWQDHRQYVVTALFAMTGLRKMEGLRLQKCDIDLDAGTLEVSGRYNLKTEGSERLIILPDSLIEILAQWMPENGSKTWVIPNIPRTGFWNEGTAANKPLTRLKNAGKEVGVSEFTFLSLRHTWATHAEQIWQVPPTIIAQNMGHSRPTTSQLHYIEKDLENHRHVLRMVGFSKLPTEEGDGTEALRKQA